VDRLTQDALQIWQAGVDAVRADRVMRDSLRWDGRQLDIHDTRIDLSGAKRLIIVGAGKAAGGMLEGLLSVIRPDSIETQGWINVPEGSIPETLSKSENRDGKTLTVRGVRICEARPRGVNEPTSLVLDGTQEILKCVEQAGPQDAVIFLLSGGGSALLCAPHDWLSLQTKVAITRALSSRGAGIEELNAVRRALSRVKGGGLARRCSAGHLVTLVISDVLGDPLEMIGSGPTVLEPTPDPMLAASLLERYAPGEFGEVVSKLLQHGSQGMVLAGAPKTSAHLFVLSNNLTAVEAAAGHAERLGYRTQGESRTKPEGTADKVGVDLAIDLLRMENRTAWITGGEPTVVLPDASIRGRGGRNQHLVLSAASTFMSDPRLAKYSGGSFSLVSGGTDGEDGSTQAAGAWIDTSWLRQWGGDIEAMSEALRRCDSYGFFESRGNLLQTGPTHTNVCDLRILLRG
jgi:hydroxypyruvate reductase